MGTALYPAVLNLIFSVAFGSSTKTKTAYLGSLIGKKEINEDTTFFFLYFPLSFLFAVPVLPPTK